MLAKFARIDDQGAYVKPAHDKLSYGGMVSDIRLVFSFVSADAALRQVFIRAQMIGSMAWSLAKGQSRYGHLDFTTTLMCCIV